MFGLWSWEFRFWMLLRMDRILTTLIQVNVGDNYEVQLH
jgi:hypothetical protein